MRRGRPVVGERGQAETAESRGAQTTQVELFCLRISCVENNSQRNRSGSFEGHCKMATCGHYEGADVVSLIAIILSDYFDILRDTLHFLSAR